MTDPERIPDPALDAAREVLRRRAESLALEQVEQADEERASILLFALGDEWYGVRIQDVREIYNEYKIASIPCVPDYIVGVINIRGEIVSVTDLRIMMGMRGHERAGGEQAVIVVSDATVCTALLVDEIGDIVDVASDFIDPPIAATDRATGEFVSGMTYTGGNLIALVNLARVLAPVVSE